MKRDWILCAEDGYGESMWEESSTLYWCGGDWFCIISERSASGQEYAKYVIPVHREEVEESWARETSVYETYRSYCK